MQDLYNKQQNQSRGLEFPSVWNMCRKPTDCAALTVINSGMCPLVLCNSVQQDNVVPPQQWHDADLRQLCTLLASRSSGLSIIDVQVHLSVLAPDAADVVDLPLPCLVEGPNTNLDNIDVFSCPMKNKKTISL